MRGKIVQHLNGPTRKRRRTSTKASGRRDEIYNGRESRFAEEVESERRRNEEFTNHLEGESGQKIRGGDYENGKQHPRHDHEDVDSKRRSAESSARTRNPDHKEDHNDKHGLHYKAQRSQVDALQDPNDLRHRISMISKKTNIKMPKQKEEMLRTKLLKLRESSLRARALKSIKRSDKNPPGQ
eukprot:Plantae.Rhodophyta-Hildenbrandia_rubra.ctg27130.p2 GENE.Plantae.Rhodophyta-Hildenbrandia_rubra.ctg27130~~Plantae.Rhodophyta-Hildenbrandia_rubra.ctg27130.p2  ORF type:complete len:183 (-),score=34.75 Plantae.Rhodophyta-Hildenbrandia_rubra.ctg27130:705-1253(-)